LAEIAPYLRASAEPPERREIFHRSLSEWLTDPNRKGRPFSVSRARGHARLADGLLAACTADRFNIAPYALAHPGPHCSEAARAASPVDRVRIQRSLVEFVLDPAVQDQRLEDPFGMTASLRVAFATVVDGPPLPSAPIAVTLGRGWQQFRRERLDARRLVGRARQGNLGAFGRELQLYPAADRWTGGARLTAAWLALDVNRAAADELRRKSATGTALDERVAALFESRAAVFEPLTGHPTPNDVVAIFGQAGGSDAEYNLTAEQQASPDPGLAANDEAVRWLAAIHAPTLVAYAQDDRADGTAKVNDYIKLNAANAYRVYRNGSLWEILRAVVRHRDADWVRDALPSIIAGALTEAGRDFTGATRVALLALRAGVDPAARAMFEREIDEQRSMTSQEPLAHVTQTAPAPAPHTQGDAWADHKRTLCALAEARWLLFSGDVSPLLDAAQQTPLGYAGFRAP